MPSIDVHCHTVPRPLVDELKQVAEGNSTEAKRAAYYLQRPDIFGDPQFVGALDERVEIMDGAGVDVEIVSTPLPIGMYFADLVQRRAVAQAINDTYSAASDRHPNRYRFFATLPLPDVSASINEFHRVSKLPGFAGVIAPTNIGVPFNNPVLEELYAELTKAKSLVFIHPCRMEYPGRYANLGMETMIGWPGEDTLAVMELVLGGVVERHSGLTVIAPHVGGTVLYLIGRIDHTQKHMPEYQNAIPH
ncbi:MAG: amidohydrolase family protein, partial [Deltaproteobacteria bacterium]|nr:amidohydrolase family protein [Deltaproteobacteria bacterium]